MVLGLPPTRDVASRSRACHCLEHQRGSGGSLPASVRVHLALKSSLLSSVKKPRGSAFCPANSLSFSGAVAPQHVRQRVVALVAGEFVDAIAGSRQRQLTLPRLRERRGVVDLELVEQRIRV